MEHNFNQKQNEEQEAHAADTQQATATEFANADEAIRADREQTVPPAEIAERLNQSLANEPKRGTSFWTKLGFRK